MPSKIAIKETLPLLHGHIQLPAFLPDATVGVVRALDSVDLGNCGVQAVVMNTFHLMQHPGSSTIQALGGLHKMCGWDRPIVTDSGGFQAYSLIRQNSRYGRLTNDGIVFKPEQAKRDFKLTPEKCVQLQMRYGSDIIMCLDDCTHIEDDLETQQLAVDRTIAWAQRSKAEFDRQLDQRGGKRSQSNTQSVMSVDREFVTEKERPLIFGIIQGGNSIELRRRCAEALLDIGFDGFGYGGWPLDGQGNLVVEMLATVRSLIPKKYPLHALGVGHPLNVLRCAGMGYTLFDCALPTRDARRGRLYTSATASARSAISPVHASLSPTTFQHASDWFEMLYINDKKHIKSNEPIMSGCDCLTCQHYTRGYLKHLFKSNDATFMRLATMHNLRFMVRLMKGLQG